MSLARAVEHAAATSEPGSATVVEPLIEFCYHVVCAPSPAASSAFTTAVHLLLYALQMLRRPAGADGDAPAGDPDRRLRLRTRALHALAVALHQSNRVRHPLLMHRRALALVLRASGDEASMWTVEPRVHIVVLAAVRLFMLSEDGQRHLAAVADRSDCPEGAWKTTYGRGRPGRAHRFFQPVVHRDNTAEVAQVSVRLPPHLPASLWSPATFVLSEGKCCLLEFPTLGGSPAIAPAVRHCTCGLGLVCYVHARRSRVTHHRGWPSMADVHATDQTVQYCVACAVLLTAWCRGVRPLRVTVQ